MSVRRSVLTGPSGSRGLSLVELLVAMALGLVLIGGTALVFRGNVRSAELGEAMASLQSSARYALDEMTRGIRAAGYRGCAGAESTLLHVRTPDAPLDAARPRASAVAGAQVSSGGWQPSAPPGYAAPTERAVPVEGTDALLLQYGEGPGDVLLASMDGPGGRLLVGGDVGGLGVGDLALVADCASSDLFEVDERTEQAGDILLRPARNLSHSYDRSPLHPSGTRVLPFVSELYYIGDSGRVTRSGDTVRSLYVHRFPWDARAPIELVEGVDQLRLSFGVRGADGNVRFVRADDAAYVPERVTSVRVGLLMSSLERLDEGTTMRKFSLAGQRVLPEGSVGAEDAAFYPDDRRLRVAFERSVTVRNRALAGRDS